MGDKPGNEFAQDVSLMDESNGNRQTIPGSEGAAAVTVYDGTGTRITPAKDATVAETHGTVAPGTVATKSELAGGVYNATPPTLTTGQQAALQVDANGSLKTVATLSSSTVTANQGTANTTANGWPVKITDGTTVAGVDTANHLYVSGKSATGVAPSANPVSVSGVDGGGLKRTILTDTSGRVLTLSTAGSSSVTSVAASLTNVQLLASNASRKGAMFFNDTANANSVIYLKLGTTATTSSFTVKIANGSYYELPSPIYTGQIDAIWSTVANGNVRITELS
jgi:hypothetical protein